MTAKIINLDKAKAKIRAIGPTAMKPARDLLAQEARLVAISCAKSTQPYGTGEAAQRAGQRAVSRDVAKVYTTPGKAFEDITIPLRAKGFWKALKAGNLAKAQTILNANGKSLRGVTIQKFDGGAAHKAARNTKTGRVNQKRPSMIVANSGALKTYVDTERDHVGYAKSAWAAIARKLGGIRGLKTAGDITANWITRKNGPGTVDWTGDEQNPLVTMTSKVPYADNVLLEAARQAAVAIARDRLIKSLKIAARAELRKQQAA